MKWNVECVYNVNSDEMMPTDGAMMHVTIWRSGPWFQDLVVLYLSNPDYSFAIHSNWDSVFTVFMNKWCISQWYESFRGKNAKTGGSAVALFKKYYNGQSINKVTDNIVFKIPVYSTFMN